MAVFLEAALALLRPDQRAPMHLNKMQIQCRKKIQLRKLYRRRLRIRAMRIQVKGLPERAKDRLEEEEDQDRRRTSLQRMMRLRRLNRIPMATRIKAMLAAIRQRQLQTPFQQLKRRVASYAEVDRVQQESSGHWV